jgi:PAS domain S-box-containing protein
VDDDPSTLQALSELITTHLRPESVETCLSGAEALERVATLDYDVIVSDIRMPGMDGLALMQEVQRLCPGTPILLITGHGDEDLGVKVLAAGAYAFSQKPINRDIFVGLLRNAMQLRHLTRALEQRTAELECKSKELENVAKVNAHSAAIVASSEDAIISKDLQGIITSWNKAAERIFGYQAHEVIGHSVAVLIPPDLPDEEPMILERIRRSERIENYETVRRRKDGSNIDISLTVSPIIDATGHIIGASKIARDITDRKQAEELVHHYRQVMHALSAAVCTCDAEGHVMLYNQAAVALWGREPEVGKDLWCGSWRMYQEDGSALPLESSPMAMAIREGQPVGGRKIVIERPDGTRSRVLSSADPMRDSSGVVIGVINVLVELSESKPTEAAMDVLVQKVRQANQRSQQSLQARKHPRSDWD